MWTEIEDGNGREMCYVKKGETNMFEKNFSYTFNTDNVI